MTFLTTESLVRYQKTSISVRSAQMLLPTDFRVSSQYLLQHLVLSPQLASLRLKATSLQVFIVFYSSYGVDIVKLFFGTCFYYVTILLYYYYCIAILLYCTTLLSVHSIANVRRTIHWLEVYCYGFFSTR